jgi:O-antigen/teichoic acid export membrane protein
LTPTSGNAENRSDATIAFESEIAARAQLKSRTARGAFVSTLSQGANFVLRTGSMMVMARLLVPKDFGLVGMVTAFTGFLGLFRDAGLSMATVHRATVTQAQKSTLFWVNGAVGLFLALLAVVSAPLIARLYSEPKLIPITIVLGTTFLFNGFGAQHRALLQRDMRFGDLAVIDLSSLVVSTGLSIFLGILGAGYWAIVAMTVALPVLNLAGVWIAAKWIPNLPSKGSGIRSMVHYGGTVTLNNLVVYLAYNAEKVLLGRFWGADALGIYGRAYQLINIPIENLNSTIGTVAFPALSRLQDDPARLKSYFLRGYSLFLTLVLPITISCALFAGDTVAVFLGRQWSEAVPVFRLLAPTILAFALINPLAWLMLAQGQAGRSLKIALMIAPVVLLSYVITIRKGPQAVALGYSIAMLSLVIPVLIWAFRGTLITLRDVSKAVLQPLVSILIAAAVALLVMAYISRVDGAFLRLVLVNSVLFSVYFLILFFGTDQKVVYLRILEDTGLLPLRFRMAKP